MKYLPFTLTKAPDLEKNKSPNYGAIFLVSTHNLRFHYCWSDFREKEKKTAAGLTFKSYPEVLPSPCDNRPSVMKNRLVANRWSL